MTCRARAAPYSDAALSLGGTDRHSFCMVDVQLMVRMDHGAVRWGHLNILMLM